VGDLERSETLDGTLSFEAKLERIVKLANCVTASLASSLFHAHVACLSGRELCDAIQLTLESNEPLRRALRGRLIRLAREGVVATEVERLAKGLLDISTAGTHKRQRVDAILSQLYPHLSPPTRSDVLQHWKSRGTRSAGARWLKAIRDDALLFGIEEVLGYWRASLNEDAAILLASRAVPSDLRGLLPEMIERCQRGWIIGRAAMRADIVDEDCWLRIGTKFPATYAYLCAKLSRPLEETNALELLKRACAKWPADDAGLVIWSIGQLVMWGTLERVREVLAELERDLVATIGIDTQPSHASAATRVEDGQRDNDNDGQDKPD
jgi:hypothetical protein